MPLTVQVVPGQVLEGLIKQNDRQRNLEHHHPLVATQRGHLKNELWGGLVKGRATSNPAVPNSIHPSYNGL